MKHSLKRVATVTGAAAATAGALLIAGSGQDLAAASTIPTGELQICAQGDYGVFIAPAPTPGSTGGVRTSTLINPGSCQLAPLSTDGRWIQIDVTGVRPDGSQFSLGSQSYNSSVSGLGIGAEGSWATGPYVWIW